MHPDDPSQRISHEAIYAAIYAQPRGSLKTLMIEALRQAKPKRGARRTTLAGYAMVPETLRIIYRPEDIEARLVPGHWEGDLIKGAFNRSAVGTVVERKTRFVILSKMNGCTASAALEGFTRQMKRLPVALRRSMSYDRGSEMACHLELSRRLKIDIWFCDPHAPWQRGSNENTNGLLRQFFLKGTDLSDLSQTALNDVARLMNDHPFNVAFVIAPCGSAKLVIKQVVRLQLCEPACPDTGAVTQNTRHGDLGVIVENGLRDSTKECKG